MMYICIIFNIFARFSTKGLVFITPPPEDKSIPLDTVCFSSTRKVGLRSPIPIFASFSPSESFFVPEPLDCWTRFQSSPLNSYIMHWFLCVLLVIAPTFLVPWVLFRRFGPPTSLWRSKLFSPDFDTFVEGTIWVPFFTRPEKDPNFWIIRPEFDPKKAKLIFIVIFFARPEKKEFSNNRQIRKIYHNFFRQARKRPEFSDNQTRI